MKPAAKPARTAFTSARPNSLHARRSEVVIRTTVRFFFRACPIQGLFSEGRCEIGILWRLSAMGWVRERSDRALCGLLCVVQLFLCRGSVNHGPCSQPCCDCTRPCASVQRSAALKTGGYRDGTPQPHFDVFRLRCRALSAYRSLVPDRDV